VGYTHFQVALPTTVGRRAAYWLQDLLMDGQELTYRFENLKLRGIKGTTGTQASFLKLFDGDDAKVKQLDAQLAKALGFGGSFLLTGQTYPRKADTQLLTALVGIAESTSKFAHDMRLLQHLKEIEEPFGKQQVGSSAMPFKRNPILAERICSLARLLIGLYTTAPYTAGTQWLERSLDDSAVRRLALPQAFLLADALLVLMQKIIDGIQVHEKVIARHLEEQLPFLITEMLLMEGVKEGQDRQDLHEKIRSHAMAAFKRVTEDGQSNDLLERLRGEKELAPLFGRMQKEQWIERFLVGRAETQTQELLDGPLKDFLKFRC
jgi:adenylosuccinate lyase